MKDKTGEIIASFAGGRPKLVESDKSMNREEVRKLLDVASARVSEEHNNHRRKSQKALRDYLIVCTALNAGLRAGELASLRVRDCQLDQKPPRLVVVGGKSRKAGSGGRKTDDIDEVHLEAVFAILLRDWVGGKCPSDFVFCSERRGEDGRKSPLSENAIWRIVKDLMNEAGLNEKYSVHTLRHRFVFAEIEAARAQGEVDPFFIARRARHRDIKQTMKYIHHDPRAMEKHLNERRSEL